MARTARWLIKAYDSNGRLRLTQFRWSAKAANDFACAQSVHGFALVRFTNRKRAFWFKDCQRLRGRPFDE